MSVINQNSLERVLVSCTRRIELISFNFKDVLKQINHNLDFLEKNPE